MSRTNYALMFGSNKYVNQIFRLLYEAEAGDYKPILTLENTNKGLLLTADISVENGNLTARVDNNKVSVFNDNYYWSGEIEKGEGLKLIQKDNHQVRFNVFITPEGDAAVTGVLFVKGMKLFITKDFLKIDDIDNGVIQDMWTYNNTFTGVGDIIISKNGVTF